MVKQIPIYRKTKGTNRWPNSRQFTVVAYALVGDHRYDELSQYHWSVHPKGDVDRREGGKRILMHQAVCGYKAPDHRDGNTLNNQESNLRHLGSMPERTVCSTFVK